MLGLYIFTIGILTFMHWDFISLNNSNSYRTEEEKAVLVEIGYEQKNGVYVIETER